MVWECVRGREVSAHASTPFHSTCQQLSPRVSLVIIKIACEHCKVFPPTWPPFFSPARPIPAPCDTSSLLTTCTVPPREPLCPQHPQVHLITWLVLFTSWLSLSMTVSGHWNRLSSWPSSSSSSAAAARSHPCHHHLTSKFWLRICLQKWCQYTAKTTCWDLIQSNLPTYDLAFWPEGKIQDWWTSSLHHGPKMHPHLIISCQPGSNHPRVLVLWNLHGKAYSANILVLEGTSPSRREQWREKEAHMFSEVHSWNPL